MGERQIFISYYANWKGLHHGWAVFPDVGPIKDGHDIERLIEHLEDQRGWPRGVATIVSFRRLEDSAPPREVESE